VARYSSGYRVGLATWSLWVWFAATTLSTQLSCSCSHPCASAGRSGLRWSSGSIYGCGMRGRGQLFTTTVTAIVYNLGHWLRTLTAVPRIAQELIRRWDSERELLRSAPRKLPEFAEITRNNAITPFKVIQGHRFWYQSKSHTISYYYLPLILHRFRDIAVDRSEIAILGYPSCV